MTAVAGVAQDISESTGHLPVLDGVRAISIVAVLVTHLFPVRIGGEAWNASLGMFGMALFFVLSGYLITGQLLQRPTVRMFASRRLFRVVPVAWLCIALVWLFWPLDGRTVVANLLFYANIPPNHLVSPIDHFWSLCVEVQFYLLAVGLLILRPALTWWLLPMLLLSVTVLRVTHGVMASSITWYRADDLLAGACLALLLQSRFAARSRDFLKQPPVLWILLLAFAAACVLPKSGLNWLAYLRPYFAAALVGVLISKPAMPMARWLSHSALGYIAAISYALYVWHLPLAATWLGSGDVLEKYLKRPLLLLVIFVVAHFSTFYFEHRFIRWGKKIGRNRNAPACSA